MTLVSINGDVGNKIEYRIINNSIESEDVVNNDEAAIVNNDMDLPTKKTQIIEDKGPIECFNQTKKSLRPVTQTFDSETDLTKDYNDDNDDEEHESYVKIPVQQLINTFEKQMRSIINQKVNENIHLNIDNISRNGKRDTTTSILNEESETFGIINRNETSNETIEHNASKELSKTIDLTPEKIHQEDVDELFDTRDNQSNGGKRIFLSVPPHF